MEGASIYVKKKVGIIGAGLGGLTSAILLANAGFDVHLYEKNTHLGGKMMRYQLGDTHFDFGPNTITMPYVFQQVIKQTRANPDDYFQIIKLDVHTRNVFSDGSTFDMSTNIDEMKSQLAQKDPQAAETFSVYLQEITRLYQLSEAHFFPKTFSNWKDYFSPKLASALRKVRPLESLDHFHRRFFKHEHHVQMLNRYATYIGSSPFMAPATFAMIAYLELIEGVYYVKGGNPTIAEGLTKRAIELGVKIHRGMEVKKLHVQKQSIKRIECENGEQKDVDLIVMNGDLLQVFPELVDERFRPSFRNAKISRFEPSTSAFVILASLNKHMKQLIHHQVYFSEAYKEEFEALFKEKQYAKDPTIYICNSSYTDPSVSPQGDNLFILVNAPALTPESVIDEEAYKQLIYQKLAEKGLDIRPSIIAEKIIRPKDISKQFYAYRGSLYGPSSNKARDAFLRPTNQAKDLHNLYFVGGSTHPGGGSPMVTLSGINVANLIINASFTK
ncbi:phytoene desaturase family protein [Halalkalibacter nanhaiisediminis]|uniref:4,4'-diaponeurosporene oxygenase n=1 Tax=Halalkalibacter nanhaiisediminis TaxID=688079 RepID=A0A562QP24_9BACI|nr:phytoene desaturase family protein [Halalkalibacter nanhaiisediminis]TWI57950.1 phytoene desaturase [Halalkalibacter nanhaiisediminis]